MKAIIMIGIIFLAVGTAAYFLLNGDWLPTGPANPSAAKENRTVDANVSLPSTPAQLAFANEDEIEFGSVITEDLRAALAKGYVLTPEDREKLRLKMRAQIIQSLVPTMDELKIMEETPVEFYGQVLDQFDQPVVGANIRCNWGIYGQRVNPLELQSTAPNGRFEITGIKAFSISILVYPPPGYDEYVSESKHIQIAKAPDRILLSKDYNELPPEDKALMSRKIGIEENYKGDKANPVIFRLKRL